MVLGLIDVEEILLLLRDTIGRDGVEEEEDEDLGMMDLIKKRK